MVRDIPSRPSMRAPPAPFIGKASVCYVPATGASPVCPRSPGASQAGRAHRPQLQERLTSQVADAMVRELDPLGVLVVIQAEHTCMTIRGVRAPGAQTVTSAVRGNFRRDLKTRAEALRLLRL